MDKLYWMFFPPKSTILITILLSATILSSVVYNSEIQYFQTQNNGTDQTTITDQPNETEQTEPLESNGKEVVMQEYRMDWETIDTNGPEVIEVPFVFDTQSNKALLFSGYDLAENDLQTTWIYDFNKNSWQDMTASMANPEVQPGPRIGYNGAYDPINDQIVIFGGFIDCYGNLFSCDNWGDTWSYDVDSNTWTELTPDNSPPPHSYGQLVYDSESKKMILFGGYGDSIVSMGETWVYDPAINNWTNMEPTVSPPRRHAPKMIYDSHTDRMIMFGGVHPWSGAREHHLNDTWSYDLNTNTWVELSPNTSPSKRIADTFFYLPYVGKSILSGGWLGYELDTFDGELYNDTWLYDYSSNTWTEISSDFPLDGTWGAYIFNNIDNTCYLYDFTEFKIRKGRLLRIEDDIQISKLLNYMIINPNSAKSGISNNLAVISLIFIVITRTHRSSKPKGRMIDR